MSKAFVLKSIWVFLLGVAVALIGLYCLVYRPDLESNSFIIMLMGLFFTGAGSIYGKSKLKEGESLVSAPLQQPWEYPYQPPQPQPQQTPQAREPSPAYPSGEATARRMETPAKPGETPSEEFLEIAEDSIETETPPPQKPVTSRPSASVPPENAAEKPDIPARPRVGPSEPMVLKIVVCPNCGAENETRDRFCYNCGNKLKPEKKKKHRKTKEVKIIEKPPAKTFSETPAGPPPKKTKKKYPEKLTESGRTV
jgi:ribosomal protein L40E